MSQTIALSLSVRQLKHEATKPGQHNIAPTPFGSLPWRQAEDTLGDAGLVGALDRPLPPR